VVFRDVIDLSSSEIVCRPFLSCRPMAHFVVVLESLMSVFHLLALGLEIIMRLSYHTIDLKWENCLKVGTDKHKLKVNMQSVSVSDDDVRKRLLEKPRFELSAKGVFRLGRVKT